MSFNFKNADLSILGGHQSPSLRSQLLPSNPFSGELPLLEPSISRIRQDSARKRSKPERVSSPFKAEHQPLYRAQDARVHTNQPSRLTLAHHPRFSGRQDAMNVSKQLRSSEVGINNMPPPEEVVNADPQQEVKDGAEALYQGGRVKFDHAISYVNKIKNRFAPQPEIYKEFLYILKDYQDGSPRKQFYARITRLFYFAPDLLEDLKQFMPETAAHANAQEPARKGLVSKHLSSRKIVIYNMPPGLPLISLLEDMHLPLAKIYEPFESDLELGYVASFDNYDEARRVVTDLDGRIVKGNRLRAEFREEGVPPPAPWKFGAHRLPRWPYESRAHEPEESIDDIMRQIETNRGTINASRSTSNPRRKGHVRNDAAAGSGAAHKASSSEIKLHAGDKHRTTGSPDSASEEEEFQRDPFGKPDSWQLKSLGKEDKMFISYTISEDRCGSQDDFISSRLAAFHAGYERNPNILHTA